MTITARELIEKLQEYDSDIPVLIDRGYGTSEQVTAASLASNSCKNVEWLDWPRDTCPEITAKCETCKYFLRRGIIITGD